MKYVTLKQLCQFAKKPSDLMKLHLDPYEHVGNAKNTMDQSVNARANQPYQSLVVDHPN